MKQHKRQEGMTVFFSYTQADQAVCDRLAIHLSQLKRDGFIEEWSDQQILAGSDRAKETLQALHSAHIILFLVSADFLASNACNDTEMQQALERHRRGTARVIPIIVILPQFGGVVECGKAVFLKQGDNHAKTTTDLYGRI